MLTSCGGIYLVHGNISRPWPSSARIFGGTGHPTCPSLKCPRRQRRSHVNGWRICCWKTSSYGLVSTVYSYLSSFKLSMVDSTISTTQSPLAINILSAVTTIQGRGSYPHRQYQCAQLSPNSTSTSALTDVWFASPWRMRIWRLWSLIWTMLGMRTGAIECRNRHPGRSWTVIVATVCRFNGS